jgi:hypothetical protein
MNYLVSPILYEGSCFNDIVKGLIKSANDNNLQLKIVNSQKGILTTSGLDNPDEYFDNSINKLKSLAENLQTGDKVLFVDFFCPGLDLLEYYLSRNHIKVKKMALMHGGSFVNGDLFSEFKWMANFENGWFELFDKIICPSNFFLENIKHKNDDKFLVIPWGIDDSVKSDFLGKKKYDVIFPHRLAKDKGIEDLIAIAKLLPTLKFCITGINRKAILNGDTLTKKYLNSIEKLKNIKIVGLEQPDKHLLTLRSSKIVLSTARQEGFGYAVIKSVQAGNIPVLPNRCCYKEYYLKKYRYSSITEAVDKIKLFLENYPKDYLAPDYNKFNFTNIINLLK